MKKKFDYRFVIIIVLVLLLAVIIFLIIRDGNINSNYSQNGGDKYNEVLTQDSETSIKVPITDTSEVTTGLEENLTLHATYYFSEIYVEENQKITAGDNILQYTNGEYLVAPYDCVITKISVPDANGQCTSKHYVTVASTKVLQTQIKVSEENIESISIGHEAKVTVDAIEKEYDAIVTNISSTASNGYFTVTIEFENDGNILLGMTGKVEI